MEAEEDQNEEPKNVNPYYCHICNIYCSCYVNLQTHFLGNKHKLVEEALKTHGFVKPGSATGEPVKAPEGLPASTKSEKGLGKTLEEQLNSCKDTEPALGLQYITEYQAKELIYECNLCGCQSGITNMFMHVLGAKHKLAYLVSTDVPVIHDDSYAVQGSDSLVTWFSEDDPGVEKKKEADKKEGDKKEADKKEADNAKSEDSAKVADETNKPLKPDNEEHQSQNTEKLAIADLSDSDSEEIQSNEDLLNYLKTFEMVTEDDATFILTVTQKLTSSLVAYRQKVLERKNTSQLTRKERCGHLEQTKRTSLNVGKPNRGFSEKQPPIRYTSKNKGTKLNFHPSNKRKAVSQNADDSARKHKLGTSVSTFVDVPSKQLSSHVGIPPSSEQHILNPVSDKNSSSQNQSYAPMATTSGPSTSENDIIAEFFSSIRNMEFDEVAATLYRVAASNPSFSGMDVENVLKILTESGNLKPKKSSSTR
uniref:Uncharacterized protein isoform X2 n=1 Tax=Pogona vitticeps TaxID=103695 RepID=A0ABM5GQS0_9SAUR